MFHFIYLKGTTQFNIDPIWSIAVANFQLLLSLVGLYIHKRLNYIKPLYTKMIKLQNLHMSKYLCPTSNVCKSACEHWVCKRVCVCVDTSMWRKIFLCKCCEWGWGGVAAGDRDQLCAGCRLWAVAGWGCVDMSALCVGTLRSSLLIHCSPVPTNR